MKNSLLILLIGIGFLSTSCATAYKSDQTPDDVYYSPGKPAAEDDLVKDAAQQEQYQAYMTSADERYLRMKVANHSRWTSLDDYAYWYDSRYDFYRYNQYNSLGLNNYNYNNNWNSMAAFGSHRPMLGWSNPAFTIISYCNTKTLIGSTAGSNITAYKNKNYDNANISYTNPKTGLTTYSNNTNNFSSLVKKVFAAASSNSNGSSTFDRAARTFSNSSTIGSSSSSSSSSPVVTSSTAGGNSGGVKSTGTSTSTGRTSRN